ncbi:TadE/TadG family type IV pilus assembly protein [Roseibium salinum]|uniref:Pilus assembly protein n=1 Tax=Roseibium salinum TaxID=1604349 RepID=A0ABT3R952_9HYPH|nr:TadE/TadG family type IV pilus assembly protein [Roseibium sp. DSM 29163]MCX2725654.1 pilus assembly protein [Roseibium sp. DSM 29163]
MVVRFLLRGFWSDRDGISLTEGLIVFPIMVLVVSALIEFSYGMHQWNQAAKAVQLGARKAAVSCPLTEDFETVFAFDPALGGELIPASSATVSQCGPDENNCVAARLDRLVNGVAGSTWPGMATYFQQPDFGPDNVVVIYEQSGLGYHGRPEGPVVSLRLELRNVQFDLPVVGQLLGLGTINVPGFPVTVSTEDLREGPDDDCT